MTNADDFNPNNVGVKGTLFGLPYSTEDAKIVVIPVPWDVTVSYGAGTSDGPEAILEASSQLDYEQPDVKEAWKIGVAMAEIPEVWYSLGKELRAKSEQYIEWLEEGSDPEQEEYMLKILAEVNRECAQLMEYVEQECTYWQEQGKLTVLLGGDHSTPLGHIRMCAKRHANLAILQIDAHADLRIAYEGFEYSHASIMYNALKTPEIKKLVQVGIRDYCEQEAEMVRNSKGRIVSFYDQLIKEQQYRGESWDAICEKIIAELPDKLYLSFDIDGLDPKLCPNTGTPVPGGFEFEQVMYLIKKAVQSGKKIVGADLNEVSPGEDEWDANVGARALYRVINLMAMSQGLI
ncbi:agmatinase family protein [Roseivirga thermotolerans]|uniref:Agmatinase n=1 Tax=Roseivirga thermotolerans TaxID=1758176 RepID=A0ABQ3I745_9BACT|nr:agmatinase family protein [Roseivirga thermotolerans]GHE63898.1 agmatinase [Roseivirga thermotolerans]